MKNAATPGARPLQKMFMAVPPSYDFLNRLLTLRMDEFWRRRAARLILQGNPSTVLDLCTGTGDLALHIRKRSDDQTEVFALDYSAPMLDIARKKASGQRFNDVQFIQGDAADMPFEDGTLDAIGIAFAFRNLTFKNPDRDRFLTEILRVLSPGGRFVAVETSQPTNAVMRFVFRAYMRLITKPIGGLLSGHRGAYHYLAHSAINYYLAPELKKILLAAGFSEVKYQPLLGGVAALWVCRK
jgi:demethylmenaquinone methyltransferase / 2-methoxy-6-polyprenyl-1,4-benzoquinol methylase